MRFEKIILNEERKVSLTAILQDVGGEFEKLEKRPAILILPGGAYINCSDKEAEPVALAYAKAGYQAFVLRYTVGQYGTWPLPLQDYEQAMDLIRNKAEEWHIYEDKIAVAGFSAGGHLAACAATMSRCRPQAAVIGYGVLTEEACRMCRVKDVVPAEHVDDRTCPCFLVATRDDRVVSVTNTLDFEKALAEKDIAFESHIYSYGMHGFSTGEPSLISTPLCSRAPGWVNESIGWLKEILGDFGEHQMTEPECAGKINGNSEEYLSADCTVAWLQEQGEEADSLLKDVYAGLDRVFDAFRSVGLDPEPLIHMNRLRDIMGFIKAPQERISSSAG